MSNSTPENKPNGGGEQAPLGGVAPIAGANSGPENVPPVNVAGAAPPPPENGPTTGPHLAHETELVIPKPTAFSLDKFKSKSEPTLGGVEPLLMALPHHKIADAKDFVRLHPDVDNYWSPELCFVNVPIKGMKHDTLHLIDEDIAKAYLPSGRIQRFRLALATKPNDAFFLCQVPSQNLDNPWNSTNLLGCDLARTQWMSVASRKGENVDGYQCDPARNQAAFPAPRWPKQSLDALIFVTFTGRMIETNDHPGLLRLIGDVQRILMTANFRTVVVVDFEYETVSGDYNLRDGDLPVPLCMVAYVLDERLQHVRTIRMWRDELQRSSRPPFDIGDDAVLVAYSAWAELTCFGVLGWPFPKHVLDLHTAYLAASNVLLPYNPDEKHKKPRKGLPDACRAHDIAGWENIDKEEISEDIGKGRWRKYGMPAVFDYCEEDVRKTTRLLSAMLRGLVFPPVDVERVLHWSNYSAKTVARIQMRGMPIDVALWYLVQENKAAVVAELLRRFDPSAGSDYPIYTPDGEFGNARFESWLASIGVFAWPRLDSGALQLDDDAFRMMAHVPGIEGLHALRDSLRVIVGAKLPIGRDGRNRPSLFPFGTATGRNAHRKSLFNCHAGLRGFMRFPPDAVGFYLDWRTQEVGYAAAGSGDGTLKRDYAGGDVYHALAHMCGLNPDPDIERWKKTGADVRQRMKSLQLAIFYGMSVPSLARGLNCHPLISSEIIERYKRRYPTFWEWRDGWVMTAMLQRRIESSFSGWSLRITTSPNQRSLCNFPMQSGGAEMLRLAAWRLVEAGIVPCMLVHDGILFEETDRERIEHAREIMRQAGRDVCGGFEIGVDTDQMLIGGARYSDKREVAKQMWETIMSVLETVGAIRRRA